MNEKKKSSKRRAREGRGTPSVFRGKTGSDRTVADRHTKSSTSSACPSQRSSTTMAGVAPFTLSPCPRFRPSSSFSSRLILSTRVFTGTHRRSTFPRIYAFSSNDIKVGSNIEVDGAPWRVLEFLHVKPGKGAAYVRTTLRNYVTGNTVQKTFRAGIKIGEADILKETKQYTYKDGSQFVFMDLNTFEEFRLNESDVGDKTKWMKEGIDCNLLFWKGKVIDFELPITVKLTVVEVDPGLRGDTAQGGSKPATVETGAVVSVPLFIERGEEIMVDARTGQYMSRA
ncbi:uncharacterized protein LOC127790076 [Diospyros lotus]|uniref:uncharacterized protein LOC127790076 n=1 Tax=Diospyros lotus TaxID=55363 RepID=UPI00224CEEDF|nr:uncharacterized protein LOC127790076 [Diospyros lotus]